MVCLRQILFVTIILHFDEMQVPVASSKQGLSQGTKRSHIDPSDRFDGEKESRIKEDLHVSRLRRKQGIMLSVDSSYYYEDLAKINQPHSNDSNKIENNNNGVFESSISTLNRSHVEMRGRRRTIHLSENNHVVYHKKEDYESFGEGVIQLENRKDDPSIISQLKLMGIQSMDYIPSSSPSEVPSAKPTIHKTYQTPSMVPSNHLSSFPSRVTNEPSSPSINLSQIPTANLSPTPSTNSLEIPSLQPTMKRKSSTPSRVPSEKQSENPSSFTTSNPSISPTTIKSYFPSRIPSDLPTNEPSSSSKKPSQIPTTNLSPTPSTNSSEIPSLQPTVKRKPGPSFPTDSPTTPFDISNCSSYSNIW